MFESISLMNILSKNIFFYNINCTLIAEFSIYELHTFQSGFQETYHWKSRYRGKFLIKYLLWVRHGFLLSQVLDFDYFLQIYNNIYTYVAYIQQTYGKKFSTHIQTVVTKLIMACGNIYLL